MRFLRQFAREGATPLLILAIVVFLYALAALGLVPNPPALLRELSIRLERGDWMFIAVCSILENTVGINGYFPGAFVILFAMASTHGNIVAALSVFGAICSGALAGQHISYFAGRMATDPASKARRYGAEVLAAIAVFWHPVLGTTYSFSAGRRRTTYLQFLAVLALSWIPWNVFWGTLMYNLGRVPIAAQTFLGIFGVYLGAWLVWALIRTTRAVAHERRQAQA